MLFQDDASIPKVLSDNLDGKHFQCPTQPRIYERRTQVLTISRTDGSVRCSFTPEEKQALWKGIVKNMAPKVLGEIVKQKDEAAKKKEIILEE